MKLSLGFRQSSRLPSDSFTPKEPDRDSLRSLEPPPGLVINESQASLFREAVVVQEIPLHERGTGRVKYRGDGGTWKASCPLKIKLPVGTPVQVLGREGLTLVVQPFDDSLD
ncbi:NfeD family protein [Lyngbya confervoides]|uniref:NfeD family protein n=1 Tax=Lyngbya confervoides TaxID=207921 RepID=UPI000907814B